ncbi:hypothetical protein AB3S75_046307 [Citrus x aurantiifolia]
MAPQKHHKDKLVEVGLEGFALLDEFYGCPKKSGGRFPTAQEYDRQYQIHHQYLQYNYYNQYRGPQVINIRDREPVINSDQAAQFYGGKGIVDYSIRTPIRRAY